MKIAVIGCSTYLTKPFSSLSRVDGIGIENYRVKVGTVHLLQDPENYDQTRNVADYVIHPDYVTYKRNDLALLKLKYPVTLNARVKIARIAEKSYLVGEHCVLAGWGEGSKGQYPERLQEVSFRYV